MAPILKLKRKSFPYVVELDLEQFNLVICFGIHKLHYVPYFIKYYKFSSEEPWRDIDTEKLKLVDPVTIHPSNVLRIVVFASLLESHKVERTLVKCYSKNVL